MAFRLPLTLLGGCLAACLLLVNHSEAQTAEAQDAEPLPVTVATNDAKLRYSGRFDWRDAAGPRCAWPATTVTVRFRGTDLNARLRGGSNDRWQIEIDGVPGAKLKGRAGEHLYRVAAGLPAGEHTVRLVKATEASFGVAQLTGLQLNQGAELLPVPAPRHRLEVIGDSISAGYGNEAAAKEEHFSAETENAYYTYGAITARRLDADYTCVAWSGKKMWPNNTIPELYDRTLPLDTSSQFDFKSWQPEAVLVNLATNDFGRGIPDEAGWTTAYKAFLTRLRQNYPKAQIYCAIGPMMGDWGGGKPLTTLRRYLAQIVGDLNAAGDARIKVIDFGTQDAKNGFGADWHPNVKTQQIMAEQFIATLQKDLGW